MRRIMAAVVVACALQLRAQSIADDTEAARRVAEIVADARRAGALGKITPLTHECYYHDLFCGQTVNDTVNIFGCATPFGGYYNVHRLFGAQPGSRIQATIRQTSYPNFIGLSDSNSQPLGERESVPGETSNTFAYTTVAGGVYYVILGPTQNLVTGPYVLSVTCNIPPLCTKPTLTQQPQPATIRAGSSVTLSVEASGTGPLNYLWSDDTSNLPTGGTTATWTTPALFAPHYYSVKVSNACGVVYAADVLIDVITRGRAVRH